MIESMLQDGQSAYSIAKAIGISQQRVSQIKRRMQLEYATSTEPGVLGDALESDSRMKSLTLRLTAPVFDALTEALAITNRQDPTEPITLEDYVGELVINRVVELGLLRKTKRK